MGTEYSKIFYSSQASTKTCTGGKGCIRHKIITAPVLYVEIIDATMQMFL